MKECKQALKKLRQYYRRGFDNWSQEWSLQMEVDRCCGEKDDSK